MGDADDNVTCGRCGAVAELSGWGCLPLGWTAREVDGVRGRTRCPYCSPHVPDDGTDLCETCFGGGTDADADEPTGGPCASCAGRGVVARVTWLADLAAAAQATPAGGFGRGSNDAVREVRRG